MSPEMHSASRSREKQEKIVQPRNGWLLVLLDLALLALLVLYLTSLPDGRPDPGTPWFFSGGWSIFFPALLAVSSAFVSGGFLILNPNQAGVLQLFGRYMGTIKQSGFFWVFPLYLRRRLSLRMHNLNGKPLKVNDKSGNPIEIAAVLVWKVEDTFAAFFEVEDYEDYVAVQSESALRHMASSYPYDSWEAREAEEITLRGSVDEVSQALERELQERLRMAGVVVLEARLSHLAYAPEVAEAMLRRQQATAIVAAREKIVEGAVGMVRHALDLLRQDQVVELDEERKAAMVSNLLVVLCGEHSVQPVVNTGTLYQ